MSYQRGISTDVVNPGIFSFISNMNIPPATLVILKCGVCEMQLSRGPVYLQHDGAALCGPCFTPERKAIRNVHYEALAQLAAFPCKYKDLGCEDTVPFMQGSEIIPHEEICEHRQWVCPVLGSAYCDWLGQRADLLQHCQDQHPDLVLQNPCTLKHDITKPNEKTYLLRWLQLLFLVHVKVSMNAGKLYHSVRYLGRSDESKDFSYIVDIKCKNEVRMTGEVAPQGCLAIQEHTSLSLNINSLLSVLGGFDGAMFTLEVQRRDCMADEECAGCERCAPTSRGCENLAQGCSHQDINSKCGKHENYFCQKSTKCLVCGKIVERGSLSVHRSSACKAVYRAGSTWRATRGWRQRCLVSGAAGTAVCAYNLNRAVFDLCVFIPVLSERLREFRCVVRVTQPATGQVRIYSPDILYDKGYDWYRNIKKTEFPSWDCVFDVSVDIIKI